MLLHLVRKDLLIAKKYVLISMLLTVAIPVFVMFLAPTVPGIIPFIYMVIFGEVLLLQAIAQEEAKHPKTIALLCASPYERKSFVLAKYLLFLLIFSYCSLVYTLVTYFIGKTIFIDLTTFLIVMLVGSIFFGVYMPLDFKYGFAKAKFAITIVILLFSLGPTLFTRFFEDLDIIFSSFKALSPLAINSILALSNVFIIGISLLISIRIFANKDL